MRFQGGKVYAGLNEVGFASAIFTNKQIYPWFETYRELAIVSKIFKL
jgi:hypothetical protein